MKDGANKVCREMNKQGYPPDFMEKLLEKEVDLAGRGIMPSYDVKIPISQYSPSPTQQSERNSDIPQTEAEARRHIEMIQNEKRGALRDRNAKDLEAALDILSNELYQKPMHFLLELLQNADDNAYNDSIIPKVKITYHDGTLRFDSNEMGFCRVDVESICSIGQSPKKKSQQGRRRIGEKGIGFKAVFRVADEVFINSGFYSFKFNDKKSPGTDKEHLGRLTPVWAKFPKEPLAGFTSFFLSFRQKVDRRMIVEEMKKLDARLIMFLHSVKEVEINVFETFSCSTKFTIRRADGVSQYSGLSSRILKPDNFSSYIIFRYAVTNLPEEEKRKGCNKSEIVLAFPEDSGSSHSQQQKEQKIISPETHKVYSFLPIRDYGFKFPFQADFVLVANREEIEAASQWNKTLRDHIPRALLETINKLNESNFRYRWPHYFPIRVDRGDFFEGLWSNTKKLLSDKTILESAEGNLTAPSALTLVPREFAGTNCKTLIPPGHSKFTYVSAEYGIEAFDALQSLGVKRLSAEDFLHDLSNFITNWPHKFQNMHKKWHSRLSEVLDPLTAEHESLISSLHFIPLRDGTWIAPQAGPLLFPLISDDLAIPNKIGFFVVHLDAANDHKRNVLLRKFKAQDANKADVCRIIIQTHGSREFDPDAVSRSDLIYHAVFLYRAGWRRQNPTDNLWVVLEDESRRLSPEVYLDSQGQNSATQVFGRHRSSFPFLHEYYSKIFHTKHRQNWLLESLMLSTIPRLVNPYDRVDKFKLNDDFHFLLKNTPALEVLQLLRAHWTIYRRWIMPKENQIPKAQTDKVNGAETEEMPYDRVRTFFSSMKVHCRDGSTAQLGQTCLPRKDVLVALDIPETAPPSASAKPTFPVLLVPEPESAEWDFLGNFGVTVKVEAKHLVRRLEQVKENGGTKAMISLLYERIEACTKDEDIGLVKREFQEKALVFIPTRTTRWVSLEDCVWDGPMCLVKIVRLKDHYPQHEDIFCKKLGLASATLKTIVAEAKQITSSDSLWYIRSVLEQLNYTTRANSHWARISDGLYDLKNYPIFPVWTGKRRLTFDALRTAGPITEGNAWYIADVPYLFDGFEGKIPLLAFDTSSLSDIKLLLECMGCSDRGLLRSANKETTIEGAQILNEEYTRSMQQKWGCFTRLIPPLKSDRASLMKQLRGVQVYQSQGVSVAWKFRTSWGTTISGRLQRGRVMIATESDALKIYLIKDYLEIGRPPLELTEEIATLCGIEKYEHILLLNNILVQEDIKNIEEDLNRRGVPDNVLDAVVEDSVVANDTEAKPQATEPTPKPSLEMTSETERLAPQIIEPWSYRPKMLSGRTLTKSLQKDIANTLQKMAQNCPIIDEETYPRRGPQCVGQGGIEPSNTPCHHFSMDKAKHRIQRTPLDTEINDSDITDDEVSPEYGVNPYPNPNAEWGHIPPSRGTTRQRQKYRNRGFISLSMPLMRDNHQDEESRFIAELYVNDFLCRVLRDKYIPHRHWTSHLRSRAGHRPFETQDLSVSTFTVQDTSTRLKGFLERQGYQQVRSLSASPTFHIQVVISKGPVSSIFEIDSTQVRKAEKLSFVDKCEKTHTDVFVLAFVFDLYIDPAIAIFADPWQLHRDGSLSLETYSNYDGCFNEKVPVLYVDRGETPTGPSEAKEKQKIKYQSLKPGEIRVLQLSPGNGDEPITGTIRHVSINSPGTFWAISYVWGTPTKRTCVYLETPQGKIPITISLNSALKALRAKGVAVSFWADAVCINQADSREKALQIRQMGKIFQQAERVVAWLGEEYGRSYEAIETLSQIQGRSETPGNGRAEKPQPRSGKVLDPMESIWDDINFLIKRPLFKRAWIAQELVLSSKVVLMCGRRSELDWDHFFDALTICERESYAVYGLDPDDIILLPDAGPAYALGLTRRKLKDQTKFSLLELLELFSHTRASIEVDKLFALLGLAYDARNADFNPDYDSTLEEVVLRYAKEFVRQGQAMDLFYRAGLSKSYPFCSWIPRWTRGSFPMTISTWDAAGGEFHAASQIPPYAEVNDNATSKSLFVKGCVVDAIQSTDRIRMGTGQGLCIFDAMSDFRRLLRHTNNYPTGEKMDDLLLKLPIGDARRPHLESTMERLRSYRDFAAPKTENWPADLQQLILRVRNDPDLAKYQKMPLESRKTVSKYWQTMVAFWSRLSNAVFCFTERRYVGLVPSDAAVGDQICLLHGGKVPFVMRQQGKAYRLIGECYIHGIMHGEALRPEFEENRFKLG